MNNCVDTMQPCRVPEASLYCPASTRIPWIPAAGITVQGPWDSYPAPESACCDNPEPTAVFNAQGMARITVLTYTSAIGIVP